MPRPTKWRRVAFMPETAYFRPSGVPLRTLDEVLLTVEESEAIRLKDLEGLQQEECAQRMKISRPTFHRVLGSARGKLADAVINGKAVRIGGGNFEMAMRRFRCDNDGHEWNVPFEAMVAGPPVACPQCNSLNVQSILPPGFAFGGRGWGRGRRGRRGWQERYVSNR